MGAIKVTSAELTAASGELKAGASTIGGELARLKGRVNSLQGGWEGTASSSFATLYAQLDAGWKKCEEALAGIAGQLGQAAVRYEETENTNTSAFGS
jgi:WXG100 family type VII secretion target